jgi:glycosyltransferase involved in cell wall biosynthesis
VKICVLSVEDLSTNIGPTIVLRNLVYQWAKSETVQVITGSTREIGLKNVKWVHIPARRQPVWLLFSSRVRTHLKDCDAIVANSYTFPAVLLAKLLLKKPCLAIIHGNDYIDDKIELQPIIIRILYYLKQKLSLTMASYLVTVSERTRESLITSYGLKENIQVIRNGVDSSFFVCTHATREDYVLFVGNLSSEFERKGIPVLLDAFARLVKEFPKMTLLFVGTDNPRLGRLSAVLGITSKVSHMGFVDRSLLPDLYNRASMFVLPSYFDPCPLVVNEAMACGTPMIVSDGVGTSDMVQSAKSGLVFQAGNSDSLYSCMKELVTDRELARTLGDNGCSYALKNLSWDVVARKYIRLLSMGSQ